MDTLLKGHGDKSEWNDYTRAVHKYTNVLWTHQADMLASHVEGV